MIVVWHNIDLWKFAFFENKRIKTTTSKISDSADDSAQVSYDDFAKTAANYCSEIIVEMLKNISIKAVL
ncbi:hypothetical protein ABE17_15830 [Bacillus mycoides]|nr:hypothetical protein [Bacillus mycoides]